MENEMIEELISMVFATRNAAHLEHWRTDSFAKHEALGDFYTGIIEGIDAIVEAHQGVFDLVKVGVLEKQPKVSDIVSQLEDDLVWINKNRQNICKGLPAIDNLIQGLEDTYMKTLYKLKRLS